MFTLLRLIIVFTTFTIISLGTVQTAYADVIVIVAPNSLTNAEGNSNASTDPNTRFQQVYAPSQFSILAGPAYITQIAFRPDGQFGRAFTYMNPHLQISLSTTSHAPDGLSTTFADNVGADAAVVYNGPLTVSSAFTGPAGGPKDFDIVITFMTPFLYDPAAGNLLADFRTSGLFFDLGIAMDFEVTFGDSVSMVAADINAPGGIATTQGYVTRFTFMTVPEPATILLLGTGLLGVAAKVRNNSRRRRRG